MFFVPMARSYSLKELPNHILSLAFPLLSEHIPKFRSMTGIANDLSQATLVVEEAPGLPLEIEYEIFVLAFKSQIGDRIHLLCVAKRVRDWYE